MALSEPGAVVSLSLADLVCHLKIHLGSFIMKNFVLIAASLALPASAFADVSFADFSNLSGLTLGGSARALTNSQDGAVIRLATGANRNAGFVEANNRVFLDRFSTDFSFRISSPGGEPDWSGQKGGDGIAFILGSTRQTARTYDAIYNDLAPKVVFNTRQRPNDPSSNYLEVVVGGERIAMTNVGPRFDSGAEWKAWIEYADGTLKVFATDGNTKPVNPLLTTSINLAGILNDDDAFARVAGASGHGWGNHFLTSWNLTSVPTPAAATILALAGATAARRRRVA
jgi:hypothetical protein